MNRKKGPGDWQYEAVVQLYQALNALGVEDIQVPAKASLTPWIQHFALLRNKTRGHGAKRSEDLASACTKLEASIDLIASNLTIFEAPWAFVRRNLSGKYRVSAIGGIANAFDDIKRRTDVSIEDGTYIDIGGLKRVDLIQSDADLTDFWVPNGNFTDRKHEYISYISGDTISLDSKPYLLPSSALPASETEGLGKLDVEGKCFANIPASRKDYVQRPVLEAELRAQLLLESHPIISLNGPGGIGKTSLAIHVIRQIATETDRYGCIIWFSARDIDLLPQGPRVVRPQGVSLDEFGREIVNLLEPPERSVKGFKAIDFLAQQLTKAEAGPTLFVFDNFETVRGPGEVFAWIDTFVRPPNKVLITTRIRGEFKADYPVAVGGMNEEECFQLIDQTSLRLHVAQMLTANYKEELIQESDGHPYVINVLLGEVAKAGRLKKVERIVATQDEILTALFERTYAMLSPAAQRVFLTLCSWRSTIPETALEAVLLRPQNERLNVQAALDELVNSSFVERVESQADGESFLNPS